MNEEELEKEVYGIEEDEEEKEEDISIVNATEEILEAVSKCNKCGLCKDLDPTYKILKEESLSGRGKAILFSKKVFDKNIFDFSLSGSCKQKCPFDIDIDQAVRKARQILNAKGKENQFNKKMLKKIKNKENPYSD